MCAVVEICYNTDLTADVLYEIVERKFAVNLIVDYLVCVLPSSQFWAQCMSRNVIVAV